MHVSEDEIEEHVLELSLEVGSINSLGIHKRDRTLQIQIGDDEIEIQQSLDILNNESTGGMVWESSLRLAKWLSETEHELKRSVYSQNILELGCGTGAFAAMISPFVNIVCATDIHALMRLAKRNTDCLDNVWIEEYDWEKHDFDKSILRGHEDNVAVIACDVLYNDYVAKLFTEACKNVCAALEKNMVLIFAVQLRSLDLLESTLKRFAGTFSIEYVSPDECPNVPQGIGIYYLRPH